jgi:3-methyladenine DNA glycosylase AlkC
MTPRPASLWREINPKSVREIAVTISGSIPFNVDAFVTECNRAWRDSRSLFLRAEIAAYCLAAQLNAPFASVCAALVDAAGPVRADAGYGPRSNYRYLMLTRYISVLGMSDFTASMSALRALTQRFTAEFDVRPFLVQYPQRTLDLLEDWTMHSNHHVRRLVSEATRPRLPWARHLLDLKRDPSPIIPLLDRLKDDKSLYVRRSVANNVADILKDNPDTAFELLGRWRAGASRDRLWLIRHAVRAQARAGNARALIPAS